MKRFNKYVSILLVITLMLGLVPPIKSSASSTPAIEVVGLYSPDASGYVNNDVTTQPADLDLVTRLTTQNITLNGTYYNFDPVQVEKFYYTVTSVKPDGTQTTVTYNNNSPVITSNTTFEFRNVALNEGLNKIVIYSVNGSTSSKAAWVYYYPVVTITDLQVNQEPFVDGMIVPSDPLTTGTGLIVTGTAPNADSLTIQVLGDSTPYSGYYNSQTGFFQFKIDSVNSSKLADFKIEGGDQRFNIIATNDTQKMTLTRSFVYNDGTPFTFENKVANMNVDGTYGELNDLVTQPVVNGVTNEVFLQGNLKVDVDPANPSALLYDTATIKIPNQTGSDSVTFDFNSLGVTTSDPAITSTLTLDTARSTDKFKVYKYTIKNIGINSSKKQQTIITEYNNSFGTYSTPIYYFDYINTNLPYISDIRFADSNISVINGTQINELPIKLRLGPNTTGAEFSDVKVYYDNNKPLTDAKKLTESYVATAGQTVVNLKTRYTIGSDTIKVYKNGALQTKGTHYNETGEQTITFTSGLAANDLIEVAYADVITIPWLPEGTHKLTVVPVDTLGIEQPIGSITRTITYIPMQYVIVNNIYNGQIFTSYSLTEVKGRLVNVPTTNTVKGYVNDKPVDLTRNADNTFVADVSGKLSEGKNVISFRIVDQANDIISESKWEIFIFTTKTPALSLKIDSSMADQFITTSEMKEGQYSTKAKKVNLVGSFSEASTINVYVYRKDDSGKQVIKEGVWTYPGFNDANGFNNTDDRFTLLTSSSTNGITANGTFELLVDLTNLGTTTIVVQATNASGVISGRTYEINREPMAYEIVYPNLDRTNVVNSNYVRIEMLAEGADAVEFKDGNARKDWIIDRQGNTVEGYVYEVYNLKPGKNKIKFTVVRGQQKISAEIEIVNANANIQGATYKTKIDKNMKAFGGAVQLDFPKGTMLKRNDDSTINPYLSSERQIMFGIAEDTYGRVDKFRHPLAIEKQKDYDDEGNIIDNYYPSITSKANIGKYYLTEPTNRFIPASDLIWIDAGTLRENASNKEDILYGGGMLPYDSKDIFYERNYSDQIVPTNRGTITMKYNSNIRAEAWPYLTIYQFTYNPDKNIYEWKNIGGVVDTKKQTITAPIDSFGYFRVMYMNQSFDDVVGHSWARIDLDTLYSKGIMVNKFNDRFVPEENITRGEFVTLLVKAFELPLDYDGPGTFYDVFKDPKFVGNALYEYKYIETAARYGIVRGQKEGTFAPNEYISRQDAAVMIARAANLKVSSTTDEKQVARTKANLQKQFTDANLIDLYAAPAVEAVVKAGLMNGKPNVLLEGQKKTTYRFDPTFELKRSEAARIVMNVMKQQKKIPK